MTENSASYRIDLKPVSKAIDIYANVLRPGPGEKNVVVGLQAFDRNQQRVLVKGTGVGYSATLSQQFVYLPGHLTPGTICLPGLYSDLHIETIELSFRPWNSDIDVSSMFGDIYVSVGYSEDSTISLSRGIREESTNG